MEEGGEVLTVGTDSLSVVGAAVVVVVVVVVVGGVVVDFKTSKTVGS